jgi:hypothetical protein
MMMNPGPPMGAGARSRPPVVQQPELDFGVILSAMPGFISITHIKCGRWIHNISMVNFALMVMGHKYDQGTGSW